LDQLVNAEAHPDGSDVATAGQFGGQSCSGVTQIEKKSVRQATDQTTVGQCTSGWAICWAPGGQRVATELRQLGNLLGNSLGNSLGNDWAIELRQSCDSWAIELRQLGN
jgi:hypothetical protein